MLEVSAVGALAEEAAEDDEDAGATSDAAGAVSEVATAADSAAVGDGCNSTIGVSALTSDIDLLKSGNVEECVNARARAKWLPRLTECRLLASRWPAQKPSGRPTSACKQLSVRRKAVQQATHHGGNTDNNHDPDRDARRFTRRRRSARRANRLRRLAEAAVIRRTDRAGDETRAQIVLVARDTRVADGRVATYTTQVRALCTQANPAENRVNKEPRAREQVASEVAEHATR